MAAMRLLHETARRGEFATGVIYIEPDKDDFIDTLNLVDAPLALLGADKVRPPKAVLDEIMESLQVEGSGVPRFRGSGVRFRGSVQQHGWQPGLAERSR